MCNNCVNDSFGFRITKCFTWHLWIILNYAARKFRSQKIIIKMSTYLVAVVIVIRAVCFWITELDPVNVGYLQLVLQYCLIYVDNCINSWLRNRLIITCPKIYILYLWYVHRTSHVILMTVTKKTPKNALKIICKNVLNILKRNVIIGKTILKQEKQKKKKCI